jgi:type II restriction enzyme
MMQITINLQLADRYTSASQKARVMSEGWVNSEAYCPSCGYNRLQKYESGRPVADFYCAKCHEEFELKSKKTVIGSRIVNGAFLTMIERLTSSLNPNLFLLNYDISDHIVKNFIIVPKHFFIPEIIEKRKALSPTARRAGWIGCNILINNVPQSGRIFIIQDRIVQPQSEVLSNWQKTLFLRDEADFKSRGWLLDIMTCIDKLAEKEFSLNQLYNFENELSRKHPENRHIKAKIRQQLQILRNKGYLEFSGQGHYRLI